MWNISSNINLYFWRVNSRFFDISISKNINYSLTAVIRTEKIRAEAEIEAVEPLEVPGLGVKIRHNHHCSMIDGKVRKVFTEVTNASQNCPICGATPTQMGRPRGELHDFTPREGALQFASFGVHGGLRSWAWHNKNRFHWDFKLWTCRWVHYKFSNNKHFFI